MKTASRLFLVLCAVALIAAPVLGFPTQGSGDLRIGPPASHAPSSSGPGLELLGPVSVAAGIRIKDTGSLAKKFVQRAGAAGADYKDGVLAAGSDWESNTKASEENYKIGVTQAANDGRFGRGVSAAGAGKYMNKASTLGAQRFPSGVAAAEGDWAKGVQPSLDALKSLDLPPRRPKGDPANQQRAAVVAQRLRAIKLGK